MSTSRRFLGVVSSHPDGFETARAHVHAVVWSVGLTLFACQNDRTPSEVTAPSSAPPSSVVANGTPTATNIAPATAAEATSGVGATVIPTSAQTPATPTIVEPPLVNGTAVQVPAASSAGGVAAASAPRIHPSTPGSASTNALGDKSKPSAGATALVPARTITTLVSNVVSGEGYRTYLQMPSPVVVGQSAEVVVNLSPQSPYKSNEKYPFRFSFGDVSGVTTPAASVTGAAATPEKTTLRFAVTGKSVGPAVIGGTFSFSVCTAEKCLVERAPLVLSFEVVADAVSASRNP